MKQDPPSLLQLQSTQSHRCHDSSLARKHSGKLDPPASPPSSKSSLPPAPAPFAVELLI